MKTKYFLILFLFLFVQPSCTIYTEKQSEALSKSVYTAHDSFEKARFDVTEKSLDEAVRLVKPPKKRIVISEVRKTINVITTDSKNSVKQGERVLIIPERFKNDTVVVVNSEEYKKLLEEKETFIKLQNEYVELSKLKQEVDNELIKQENNRNKMIDDLNSMQKQLIKKDLVITRLYIVIGLLASFIVASIYLKIKGII